MGTIALTARADDSQTGASLAWTSDAPDVSAARDLLLDGKLMQAERALAGHDGPAEAEMLELVRRMRREYSLDEAALLGRLRESIPDVTADDLRRWRQAGEAQFREIDGDVRYFRREPANIFRFCEEAKDRQKKSPDDPPSTWNLTDHLAKVIAAAEASGQTEVEPIQHRITFTVTIPPGAGGARVGSVARVWLPFPQEYRQQKEVTLVSSDPPATRVAENGSPHRTIYYERVIDDPTESLVITAVFDYASWAYCPRLRDGDAKPLAADGGGVGEYLDERPPHVVFTRELRERVKEIVGDETNPLARARKIFYWIDGNVRYCAEEEYCLISSFATKALTSLKGDCGIQSNLFITMCRAAGVPARWQGGWETQPVGWSMHDWAEFYVEPWGWLPADPSYGLQKSDDAKVREFYFGHQDSYRLIVNLDYGRALSPSTHSLRSEPADFQRGEVEIDGKNLYFDEWDYDFKFEQRVGD